uniref:Uncharacterized protein n=1 Tax=Fibrocapsa japonica TaxID=94617 RepID=A0A7S2V8N0_9STRA|mmetsp:Transcript_8257/g.12616  ORF Transcript_8257/g.12616 Transcript_8257/m.12616 type:complete len:290 (+) Transcript_8257:57-926(+)|eukprot:CAMPEP_0113934544 /NCGR_PEP_ID=MMETSP1339-20121228/1873_1 /TAXON_ID=94617 /ORGANISM="Fibrocapsa japonica" /LENGTH=289 /DNA_ID=CAMNT_0000936401 /DNA_START=45 /DNA_END=914 /DNA_ORIENTATION=+ /assembly_acc=CAM_ASM_000762
MAGRAVLSTVLLTICTQSAAFVATKTFPHGLKPLHAIDNKKVLQMAVPEAILFDCDGVLADTERDGHRPAFNAVFEERRLDTDWTPELYGRLLEVGGGKERMTAHWNEVGWPSSVSLHDDESKATLVKELHLAKTDEFNKMIKSGAIPLREGVLRLVDEAISNNVSLAVCSTSNEKAVKNLVLTLMGEERYSKFQFFCGDMVKKKKPAPDVYLMAKDSMGLDASKTIIIEDSGIGLQAAKASGMKCLVTKSSYTENEDFSKADCVVSSLDDGNVTLEKLGNILEAATVV